MKCLKEILRDDISCCDNLILCYFKDNRLLDKKIIYDYEYWSYKVSLVDYFQYLSEIVYFNDFIYIVFVYIV